MDQVFLLFLNRLFHNEIYIGRKHVIFHKPDPTNPEPIEKRKDREVVFEYDEYDETIRIIPDDIWYAVQEKLLKAAYNKNNAVKRENLLKPLMKCGECGSTIYNPDDLILNYEEGYYELTLPSFYYSMSLI